MKRPLKLLGWAMLASLVLGAALVVPALSAAGSLDPLAIRIDGETVSLAQLDAGEWLLALFGIGLALLIVVLVVPLAVLLPLAFIAVALVGVLLVLAGVLAMVFSPLILALGVIWLIVRWVRRDNVKPPAVPTATIPG